MEPSNTSSSSCDFVIPFCPFERTLLTGVKAKYSSLLDPVIQRCSLLEEHILSRGGAGLLRDLGKLIVARSDLHMRTLEESDTDSEDNTDVSYPSLATSLKMYLFQGWRYAQTTGTAVLLSQTQFGLKDHNGDHAQSYTSIISTLHGMPDKKELFRSKSLEQHNASVRSRLTCNPPPKLIVVPATSDSSFWDVILGMYLVGHRTHLQNVGKKADLTSDSTYEIWQVAQQFSLACRRPANGSLVEKYLFPLIAVRKPAKPPRSSKERETLNASDFTPKDAVVGEVDTQVPPTALLETLETLLNTRTDEAELSMPMIHASDMNSKSAVGTSTAEVFSPPSRSAAARSSLHDPRGYVEIIPWVELEPVSPTVLEEAHIPIVLPHRTARAQEASDVKWMLWKPPSSNFFDCHHLFTEDEVYQYCVENDWHFPGQFYGDRVVFALSPLKASRFVDDLEHFWDTWNNCALTTNPSDEQLYLLETISGRNYRLRRGQEFVDRAGGLYFRNVIEAHAQQQNDDAKFNVLLGRKYNLKYQYMLRYIHPEQLTDFTPKPLGSGTFGAVYGALWRQPTAFLHSMRHNENPLAVVVKHILPKFHRTEAIEKILYELDITFTALEGTSTSSVAFYGITALQVDETGTIHLASNGFKSSEEKLFLVFERASEGNFLDFVERDFINATREESWSIVIAALTSIASGLVDLHRRHLTHGDLHPGNILVTKRFYQAPPPDHEEYDYLLTDFGGGGYIGYHSVVSSSGRFEYHVGDYLAPEIKIGRSGSAEADIFSLGCIGRTLVSLRRTISAKKGSIDWETIPKALKAILDDCTASNHLERPQTFPLVRRLEDLYVPNLMKDETAWSVWDGDRSDLTVLATDAATIQTGGHVARARAQVDEMLRRFG